MSRSWVSNEHLMELSLRHLPDLSDTSFEIPTSANLDNLLEDPKEDFLDVDNASFGILVPKHLSLTSTHTASIPPPMQSEHPTSIDLTPKPNSRPKNLVPSPPPHGPHRPTNIHKEKQAVPASVLALRQKLKERQEKNARSRQPAPKSTNGIKPIIDRTVDSKFGTHDIVEGPLAAAPTSSQSSDSSELSDKRPELGSALAKHDQMKLQPPEVEQAVLLNRSVLPKQNSDQQIAKKDQAMTRARPVDGNESLVGGAAERLLSYGQMLSESIDLLPLGINTTHDRRRYALNARPKSQQKASTADTGSHDVPTPSQLPPSKEHSKEAPSIVPACPSASARKRPALEDAGPRKIKKEKSNDVSSAQMTAHVPVKPTSRLRRKPAARTRSMSGDANKPSANTTRGMRDTVESDAHRPTRNPSTHSSKLSHRQEQEGMCDSRAQNPLRSEITDRPNPTTELTKPVEFAFRSDARLQTRNQPSAKQFQGSENIKAMSDAKASRNASSVPRKENTKPTRPLPLKLSTATRAKEREKFDQMVRMKDAELERQKEERRIQQELEEEVQIKELRKKAIPKAHAVPEWYSNVPRKKGQDVAH